MKKKKHVTDQFAYRKASKALAKAADIAESRGEAEALANIALTWMELAARLEKKAEETKSKIGFNHDHE